MNRKPSMLRPGIRRLLGLDVPRKEVIVRELEDELQLHLDLRAEQLRKQGLSSEAAIAQARARYGPIQDTTQEIHRHARRREQHMQRRITFDSLAQDVRYALRTLGRAKGWTAVAVLTLALGIGANTAVFSVVNDLLLDPMRYPDRDRLRLITQDNVKSKFQITPSFEQLIAWRSAKSFDGLEGVATEDLTLSTKGAEPATVHAAKISATFTRFAGARMLLGRTIQPDDVLKGAPPVVVLSEHVWRGRFGKSSAVIGQTLKLEETERTIIGVMADGVRTPSFSNEPSDLWIPLDEKVFFTGPVIGRLKIGVSTETAQQELQAISVGLTKQGGKIGDTEFDIAVRAPGSTGSTRSSVFLIAGAVCLLLLIACANVAHLLLARGAAREREMAIRAALGAGRSRIARQLVTESMILALAGCVAGMGVGALSLRAMVALRPERMGELSTVQLDSRAILATIVVSMVCGLLFGLIAGYGGRRSNHFDALRASVASTMDRKRHRIRSLLVVTENALSVVLLIGAMLLIRTVVNLYDINPGFDANGLYGMSVSLPGSRYATPVARQAYVERLLAEARRLPGVTDATIASYVPPRSGIGIGKWVTEEAAPPTAGNEPTFTAMNHVMPDYFSVMRMQLMSGRTFDAASASKREVIVNQSLATSLWGQSNPVGKRLRMSGAQNADGSASWYVVAGVASQAAVLSSLSEKGKSPAVYYPAGTWESEIGFVIRMRSGQTPHAMLRQLSLKLDPSMPPPAVVNVNDLLLKSVSTQRFMMVLLTSFAVLAVILSAIGLYGVIAYMVHQNTREIGVRVALGAARRDIVRLVARQGVLLSAAGLLVGLAASVWGARLLQHSLYGITANDPLSYLVGSMVLLLLAVCACVAPTLRALRIDPMAAMRSE